MTVQNDGGSEGSRTTRRITIAVEEYLVGLEKLKDEILAKYPDDVEELLEIFDPVDFPNPSIDSPSSKIDSPVPFVVTPFIDEDDRVLGGFEAIRKLGDGGQGTVFRARLRAEGDKADADIALKIGVDGRRLDTSRRLREIMILRGLDHPNLVQVYFAGKSDRGPFIASELVEGVNLSKWLETHREPIGERKAAEIVQALASALHAAHEQGVVHCDLKPANVFGCGETIEPARLKIGDFGLSRFLPPETLDDATQRTFPLHTIGGTPPYMAPEQFRGESDRRSDIFALGMILSRLCDHGAQSPSSEDRGDREASFKALKETLGAIPSAERERMIHEQFHARDFAASIRDPRLRAIVAKCLEFKRENRYQTAGELVEDLEEWLKDRPIRRADYPYGFRELLAMLVKRCRDRDELEDHSELWGFACLIIGVVGFAAAAGTSIMIYNDANEDASRLINSLIYITVWFILFGILISLLVSRHKSLRFPLMHLNMPCIMYLLGWIIVRFLIMLDKIQQAALLLFLSSAFLCCIGIFNKFCNSFLCVGIINLVLSYIIILFNLFKLRYFPLIFSFLILGPQALSALLFGLSQTRTGSTFRTLRERRRRA